MSLAGRLNDPPRRTGFPCSVGVLHTALPADESAALDAMLASPRWSDRSTAEALADEGHRVSEQQLGKHRRRQCSCRDTR